MPPDVNQIPEQVARDRIDGRLRAAGWQVQDENALNFQVASRHQLRLAARLHSMRCERL